MSNQRSGMDRSTARRGVGRWGWRVGAALGLLLGVAGAGHATFVPIPILIATPPSVDFGSVVVGQGVFKTFTLINAGNVPLSFQRIQTPDAYYDQFNISPHFGNPIQPGDSGTCDIYFQPTRLVQNLRFPLFFITDMGASTPVDVTATAVNPPPPARLTFTVSPARLEFGKQRLGTESAGQTFTVTNTGNVALDVVLGLVGSNPDDFPPDLSSFPEPGVGVPGFRDLEPSKSWTVTYFFKPTGAGPRSATIILSGFPHAYSGPPSRQYVDVFGTGVTASTPLPPPPPPPPTGPTISGYAATNPRGVRISSAPPGAPLLIEGSNFGSSGTVAFNGIPTSTATSWSATEILVTVPAAPSYPFKGPVTVTVNNQSASGPAFTITPPTTPIPPPPAPVVATASADWPVFMHDPGQAGRAGAALDLTPLSPWSVTLGSKPGLSPVVAAGVAYIGTEMGGVFAIDTATHLQRWQRPLLAPVRSAPAVGEKVVVVSAGGLYGLNPVDGAILWQRLDIAAADLASPMLVGDTVYLGGQGPGGFGQALYAVKAATGANAWAAPALLPAGAQGTVAVDAAAGLLFVSVGSPGAVGRPAAGPSAVVALKLADGSPAWPGPAVFSTLPAASALSLGPAGGSSAVFVAAGGSVTALNEATGVVLWAQALPEASLIAPLPAASSQSAPLFVAGASGQIYLLDARGAGAPKPLLSQPLAAVTGTPALAGSLLLVPTTDRLVAVDTGSGGAVWSSPLAAAAGVVVAGGGVFAAAADGHFNGFTAR